MKKELKKKEVKAKVLNAQELYDKLNEQLNGYPSELVLNVLGSLERAALTNLIQWRVTQTIMKSAMAMQPKLASSPKKAS